MEYTFIGRVFPFLRDPKMCYPLKNSHFCMKSHNNVSSLFWPRKKSVITGFNPVLFQQDIGVFF